MFERRLKILIFVIFVFGMVLLGRLFAVQVWDHKYWSSQAAGLFTRTLILETNRGRILDAHGKPMAIETACTDACVDYRAIIETPDSKWVHEIAFTRLNNRLGAEYKSAKSDRRAELMKQEIAQVKADILDMWAALATLNQEISGEARANSPEVAMDEIRRSIIQSVQTRRQWIGARNHQLDETSETQSGWLKFLSGGAEDSGDSLGVIAEQTQAHVVLPALDSASYNFLGTRLEKFPGLVLRPSVHRVYPLKDVGCHYLGRLSHVSAADLAQNKRDNLDDSRAYLANDLIGREGIESLCEPLLRGRRGKIETRISDGAVVSKEDFVPGVDVKLSIDSDLQKLAQDLLQHVVETDGKGNFYTPEAGVSMHGAVVILDVKTNQVRVMASNPGFDLNDLQTRYPALIGDVVNEPLLNRATAAECEPGSTVKPMVGIGGITQGVITTADTIDCTGYLYLPGLGRGQAPGRLDGAARCWLLSENMVPVEAYQQQNHTRSLPSWAMHHQLTFPEAIERSCDIFFETLADRMGTEGLNHIYDEFGIGRPTGIGIYERPGYRPETSRQRKTLRRVDYCLAGMGQGPMAATPLQIANEAATIARNGIWMRPSLLDSESQAALNAVHPSPLPDRDELHLSPEALAAAKTGMVNVVDGPAGTGRFPHPDFTVAAKTGTADTSVFTARMKASNGQMVLGTLPPVQRGGPETATPWLRASAEGKMVHGWFMGYAPAEDPQIAFCVLVQYAGAGGSVSAGPIARQMLEACARAGYLRMR